MPAAFTTADPVAGVGYATKLLDWRAVFANTIYFKESRAFGRMTADLTKTTDTAFANLSGLAFAIAASEIWTFLAILHGISPVAADIKFTLTGPAAPSVVRFGVVGAGNLPLTAGSNSVFGNTIAIATSNLEETWLLGGLVVNGVNAGTVQLQAAQNASSGSTIVRAGSSLLALRFDA